MLTAVFLRLTDGKDIKRQIEGEKRGRLQDSGKEGRKYEDRNWSLI